VKRAVLDTNVLASGIAGYLLPESTPGEILRRWRQEHFALLISEPIPTELERTLQKPYFRARVTPDQRDRILRLLIRQATLVEITVRVQSVATHREDDVILATAVSSKADWLVTGDVKVQRLGSYQGVTILSPRAFLDLLEQARQSGPQ
jgi:putative PIN family toxin of toxin-antitoxin system